jgi:hypothetical protein
VQWLFSEIASRRFTTNTSPSMKTKRRTFLRHSVFSTAALASVVISGGNLLIADLVNAEGEMSNSSCSIHSFVKLGMCAEEVGHYYPTSCPGACGGSACMAFCDASGTPRGIKEFIS